MNAYISNKGRNNSFLTTLKKPKGLGTFGPNYPSVMT